MWLTTTQICYLTLFCRLEIQHASHGLKSGWWQDWVPFWKLEGVSVCLPFPTLWRSLTFLGKWSYVSSKGSSDTSLWPSFHYHISTFKDHGIRLGLLWIIQDHFSISRSFILIISAKYFLPCKVAYPQVLGMRDGHLWEPLFCLP